MLDKLLHTSAMQCTTYCICWSNSGPSGPKSGQHNLHIALVSPSLTNPPLEEFEICETKRSILKILKFSLPACTYPLSCLNTYILSGRGLLIQSLPDMMYPPGRPNPKGGWFIIQKPPSCRGGLLIRSRG